ncbi:MAG: phosphate propanoyltransferase [Bacillota bacterium]
MLNGKDQNFYERLILLDIPVGISNRHVHLTQQDLDELFGPNYQLAVFKELSQPGEFASQEVVTLVGPRGVLEGVRILGPARNYSQIEISMTDAYRIGLRPPVRDSGKLDGTPGIAIVGQKGALALKKGVILAARHIHMSPAHAKELGVQKSDKVQVYVNGERGCILENVLIRVHEKFVLEMHIDTDEANCALIKNGDKVHIVRNGSALL